MKKLIAALLTCTLAAAMMAGCGSAADDSSASSGTDVSAEITQADNENTDSAAADEGGAGEGSKGAEGTDTNDGTAPAGLKTAKEGVLTMATNAAFPPYEFYESNKITGIDVEIAEAIAGKLGLELKIEDMEFGSIIIAVTQGKADMGLAGMTVTEERLESVDFSDSYATGIQAVIVAEDSEISEIADLNGKKIGVQLATTGDIYAKEDFGEDSVEAYNKGADAVMALKQGKVDAVIIDNQPALSFVKSTEGLKILETEYAVEDYAAAIAKDNDALVQAVNGALAELKADGTIQSIIDKYIVTE
ncbi:MAG: amino acid ABC transporter substrate-binding protein [Eubacterium sp.]|jgi:ABC-type amino acid transport substrate-binding protein|nr:amino acid ABC transporter substrate-binding protein [Eubacterium sp.]